MVVAAQILFITEIDNMSYHLGLGERAKQRVDQCGHVVLTDDEAAQLSRTKALCTLACVFGAVLLVANGALWACLMAGAVCALVFRLSELATTWTSLSNHDRAIFIAKTIGGQLASVVCFFAYYGWQQKW